MYFSRLLPTIWLLFITILIFSQEKNKPGNFISPLDIPLLLSGNFGELRSTHFHSGIDFKTQQQTGKNVYASNEGYVSRIKIQAGGYGKSLYILHPDGYTSVYAHLNDYIPQIARYVKDYQYKQKNFEVDIYLQKNDFPVTKGQLVAQSGNTGNSGGPHLHFEIRDASQNPLNVLQFNLNILDNIAPEIVNLAIYPVEDNSFINGKNSKLILKPVKINGIYTIQDSLKISGKAGFGIETYDYLNGSGNKCTVYSIELAIDDTIYYYHEMDKLSWGEMKYINSHLDYEENLLQKIKLHKLHLDPNNKAGIYRIVKNRGIIHFSDDTVYKVRVTVKDTYLNTTHLEFNVRGTRASYIHRQHERDSMFVKTFFFDQRNEYQTPDLRILVPEYSLFKNIHFSYSAISVDSLIYSDLHFVHTELVPLCRSYNISIRTKNLPERLQGKALIASVDRENKINALGGEWRNGFVTSSAAYFGKFFVAVDTLKPVIKPVNFKSNGYYSADNVISFEIKDEFSGIKTYNGYIDNEWALFEYDRKVNLLSYRLDQERVLKGGKHTIEIVIVDNCNNIAVYRSGFYY